MTDHGFRPETAVRTSPFVCTVKQCRTPRCKFCAARRGPCMQLSGAWSSQVVITAAVCSGCRHRCWFLNTSEASGCMVANFQRVRVVSWFQMLIAAPHTLTVVVPTTASEPAQHRGELRRLQRLLQIVYFLPACVLPPCALVCQLCRRPECCTHVFREQPL